MKDTRKNGTLILLPFIILLFVLPFPHTVAIRSLSLAAALFIAFRFRQQYAVGLRFPNKPVTIFWAAICALSLVYAADPLYTLNEIKNEVGYSMAAFFAFFVIASHEKNTHILFRTLAAGLLVIGGWAFYAWVVNGYSWDESGGYGGVGVFATYLVTILPAIVWMATSEPSMTWRRFAIALSIFIILLAFATGQRAVWPALMVELLLLCYLMVRMGKLQIHKAALLIIVTIVLFVGMFAFGEQRRFGESAELGGSILSDTRFAFWPSAIEHILQHPWSGGGLGRRAMAKAYPELIPQYNAFIWHTHNLFLNYGISMGIPGILAIVALFGAWLGYFWKSAIQHHALIGAAGVALVAGVMLRNQLNDFFVRDMSLLFWAQIGLFARMALQQRPAHGESA